MRLTDLDPADRPRERMLQHGAEALSDAELLAIFLRVGMRGKSAVELAREMLAHFDGDLGRLAAAPIKVLSCIPGIGPAKASQLAASLELARRALESTLVTGDILASPKAVRDWLGLRLGQVPHEVFLTLWLDSGNRLIAAEELFRGTLSQTSVHPREVVKHALSHNAAAVVLAHNHPSGRCEPSAADTALTRALTEALALVDVKVVDHFIVVPGQPAFSFAEHGMI